MPRFFSAARIARLVVTSAGCCTSVSTSSSTGESKHSRRRSRPDASEPTRYTSIASGTASATSLPMPGASEPCPGKQNATLLTTSPSPFRPLHERGAPRQARTHPGHQYELTVPQPAVGAGIRERERDRARRRVSISVHIDHDLLHGDAELSGSVVDDPLVGLMRNVDVDLVHVLAALLQHRRGRRHHHPRRELEDLAAVHPHE